MGPSEGVLCVRQKNEERYALLTQFYTTNIFELETCSLGLGMTLFGALTARDVDVGPRRRRFSAVHDENTPTLQYLRAFFV